VKLIIMEAYLQSRGRVGIIKSFVFVHLVINFLLQNTKSSALCWSIRFRPL